MRYTVKLKDGTLFIGKRTLKNRLWDEGFFETVYTVIDSETIPMGSVVHIPVSSVSYKIKR